MQVRNISTGAIETLRHGPAVAAVSAGTHEHVNLDPATVVEDPKVSSEAPSKHPEGDIDRMSKDELVTLAGVRGIDVKAGDTKADILAALKA